jgi:carboxymethylenebutenolidase
VGLRREWVEYEWSGTPVPAFVSWPARAAQGLPAIVVIQEVWGVTGHVQDLASRFAAAGYLALAPDLYAHGGRRPEALASSRIDAVEAFVETMPPSALMNPAERETALARLPEPQRRQVGETLGVLFAPTRPMDQYVGDLRAAVAYLRTHPVSRGQRVGAVGYCMGGGLVALLACSEPDLAAAVTYYGASPPADRIAGIRCPVLGLYGGADRRITEGVPAFAEAMRAAGKPFEHRVYPGAPHAFFNDEHSVYRVDAARDAWVRTLAFFAEHLVPAGGG